MEATLDSKPSQIWRSILNGRNILAQGLIHHIGDGRNTRIWADNWIPRDNNMRPFTSIKANPPQLVSKLIDETSASWNEAKIHEFFLPMDVLAIMSIPLSTRRQADFIAWNFDSRGIFSVRSAYRMMVNLKISRENYFEGNTSSSSSGADEKGWTTLWKTPVPSKLRVFLWRLAQQSLPIADLLHHRHMSTTSTCHICGEVDS
jgi:hypothetical protein